VKSERISVTSVRWPIPSHCCCSLSLNSVSTYQVTALRQVCLTCGTTSLALQPVGSINSKFLGSPKLRRKAI